MASLPKYMVLKLLSKVNIRGLNTGFWAVLPPPFFFCLLDVVVTAKMKYSNGAKNYQTHWKILNLIHTAEWGKQSGWQQMDTANMFVCLFFYGLSTEGFNTRKKPGMPKPPVKYVYV